jgi:hypothetical protein
MKQMSSRSDVLNISASPNRLNEPNAPPATVIATLTTDAGLAARILVKNFTVMWRTAKTFWRLFHHSSGILFISGMFSSKA